LLADYFVKL
jgi:hypothetical protein